MNDLPNPPPPEDELQSDRQRWAFHLVRDGLTWAAPSPEVQEALYETYLRLPGVENDGKVEDAVGRTSIALGVPSSDFGEEGGRRQLLFDPDTHTYHGWRVVYPDDWGMGVVVSTEVVDEPEQVP